ncbi:MAG: hypothetical protein AAF417_19365, partial [Pseudomonadota bacterium]
MARHPLKDCSVKDKKIIARNKAAQLAKKKAAGKGGKNPTNRPYRKIQKGGKHDGRPMKLNKNQQCVIDVE